MLKKTSGAERTIGVVTSTRADYGIMKNIIKMLDNDGNINLLLFVTGSHLLPEYGNTYKEIENDGFHIDEKIEISVESDNNIAICKSMGQTTAQFAETLSKYDIDILLVLGDRYEIFSVVSAAYMLKIPIAHISGGDSTEGALDEALRHCITKMSYLHFVTNEMAKKRVIQLGENPNNVFLTGNPSLDGIHNYNFLDINSLSEIVGIKLQDKIMLVTYHPETLDISAKSSEIEPLLRALDLFILENIDDDVSIVFTGVNADSGGRGISQKISEYVSSHDNCAMVESLGHLGYMSAVKIASAVVGNSSSGLVEAPSFKTATVNIGNRQKGRICADSVISVPNKKDDIIQAINKAISMDCSNVKNPYEFPEASSAIFEILENTANSKELLNKKFFDIV